MLRLKQVFVRVVFIHSMVCSSPKVPVWTDKRVILKRIC